jgi:hypothetical protein
MQRPQDEFWHSSLAQVAFLIDMYADEELLKASAMKNEPYESKYFQSKEEVNIIHSMKEVEGW